MPLLCGCLTSHKPFASCLKARMQGVLIRLKWNEKGENVCGWMMNGGIGSVIECCVDEWKKGEFWGDGFVVLCF